MSPDVTVLGSANVDMVLNVERYPGAGETIVAADNTEVAGGKGLNQAVACARAGARTAFVAAVGDDEAGRTLLATMRGEGIEAGSVRTLPATTGRAVVVVQPSGENTIFVVPGANSLLTLDDDAREVIASSAVLVAQLEVSPAVVAEALAAARRAGVTTVLNAAPALPLDDDVLRDVDVLVVNEHEASILAGHADPHEAARQLTGKAGQVVVTLGAAGALHVGADLEETRVPGLPADAVDTTGAGDTFVGALAAALAQHAPMSHALRRAVAASSLAVERAGATTSIPTRRETDVRIAEHWPDQVAPRG